MAVQAATSGKYRFRSRTGGASVSIVEKSAVQGAALAFALGRQSGSGSGGVPSPTPTSGSEALVAEEDGEQQLPCTKHEAKRVLDSGALGRNVMDAVPQEGRPSDYYELRLVGCRDLTGDGLDEMVIWLAWGTSSSPTPWAVLSQRDGSWRPEFVREWVIARLKLAGDGIRERSPAYGPDDPFCCPSGERTGTIRYENGEWLYRARGAPKRLDITCAADGSPGELAGIPLLELDPVTAIATLGRPGNITPQGNALCTTSWSDLGLTINFANLGGKDPCGPAGRVGSLTLFGPEARLAGWLVDGKALIGARKAELRELYPEMRRAEYDIVYRRDDRFQGSDWVLRKRKSPYGDAGIIPSLQARIAGGEVVLVDVAVAAAGE